METKHHATCRETDRELVYHCYQCGINETAPDADRLREINAELVQALQAVSVALSLQAYRDASDPVMLEGWRVLEEQARAALAKAKGQS